MAHSADDTTPLPQEQAEHGRQTPKEPESRESGNESYGLVPGGGSTSYLER